MKKHISLLLTVIIGLCSVSLIACGEKTPTTETVTVYGEFYTVQEAYDNKLLTLDDFAFIEKNEKTPENYVALDDETQSKMHDDYYATHALVGDDMQMINYGSYNGCRAVFVQDMYYDIFFDTLERIPYDEYSLKPTESRLDDIDYPTFFWRIRIWKEYDAPMEKEKPSMPNGVFYSVKRAYSLGFLNDDELMKAINSWSHNVINIDRETENSIIQDYKALDMETNFNEIHYQGIYRDSIVLRIWDFDIFDAYQQVYYFKVFDKGFNDILPVRCVWIPIEKIL